MATYTETAKCKFVVGNLNDLAQRIQALIDGGDTILQVVRGRETGRFLIILV